MKKSFKFGPMIVAVVIVLAFVLMPLSLERAIVSKHAVRQAASSLDPHIFQGQIMQQRMLEDKQYLPIYGSSELLRLDRYHPSNYFQVSPQGFTPFLIGRGGMYSFVHFLNFASSADLLKGHKIVFILSPEWFTQQGLDAEHFKGNFSKQQVYALLFHPQISAKLRQQAAKRLLDFRFVRKDQNLATLLKNAAHPGSVNGALLAEATAQGYLTYKVLTLHDLVTAHDVTPGYKPFQRQPADPKLAGKSWDQLRASALKVTEKQTAGNAFGIDQSLYRRISGRLVHFQDYRKGEDYSSSPEYHDLQLAMDVLKQKHVKALFVSVPFNGSWYDYAGVPKATREVAYQKIARLVKKNGFQLADFSRFDDNSRSHFLQDTMHISPLGWVYIDQAIQKFAQKK
ncbi:MAG: D-alanyl-lipoteichoic acid biosynthesis protein DltD [Sporolactobacillus sp.]